MCGYRFKTCTILIVNYLLNSGHIKQHQKKQPDFNVNIFPTYSISERSFQNFSLMFILVSRQLKENLVEMNLSS